MYEKVGNSFLCRVRVPKGSKEQDTALDYCKEASDQETFFIRQDRARAPQFLSSARGRNKTSCMVFLGLLWCWALLQSSCNWVLPYKTEELKEDSQSHVSHQDGRVKPKDIVHIPDHKIGRFDKTAASDRSSLSPDKKISSLDQITPQPERMPLDMAQISDFYFPDGQPKDMPLALPCELTENNAAQWQGVCNDNTCGDPPKCSSPITFSDDKDPKNIKEGAVSLKFDCPNCGLDNYASLTNSKGWNLSGYTRFRFWLRTNVPDSNGWQNQECGTNPWIILRDTSGNQRKIEGNSQNPPYDLNKSRGSWLEITGPISKAGNKWEIKGATTFNLSHVDRIEIHMDPWGWAFTAWIDGLTFFDDKGNQFTGCNP